MEERIQDQLAVIDRLAKQKPQYQPALASYRQLLEVMRDVSESVIDSAPADLPDSGGKPGRPLFQRQSLPIDLKTAAGILAGFMKRLSRTDREDRQGLMNALEKLQTEPEWGAGLFQCILNEDEATLADFAQQVALDPRGLAFLARTALTPAMESLRSAFADRIDTENWNFGCCPLCGSRPDMACFNDSGKRHLHCELCGTQWTYQRIGCPFCGNENHEQLGYLEAEEESGLRVYFCKNCLKYIKTVDKRVFEETPPLVLENIVTLHLDLLALEANYG